MGKPLKCVGEPVVWWWYLLISGWVGLTHVRPPQRAHADHLRPFSWRLKSPATQIVIRWLELAHFCTHSHEVSKSHDHIITTTPTSTHILTWTHSPAPLIPVHAHVAQFPNLSHSTAQGGRRNGCHHRPHIYILLLSHILFFLTHTLSTRRRSHTHYTYLPSLLILTLPVYSSYYTDYSPSVQLRCVRYPHFLLLPSSSPPLLTCDIRIHSLTYTIRIRTLTTLLIIATFLT